MSIFTTPVSFPGRMKDFITSSLPLTGGAVGRNGPGSPMALMCEESIMEAIGCFLGCVAKLGNEPLRSTPFVALFATQLFAQLIN